MLKANVLVLGSFVSANKGTSSVSICIHMICFCNFKKIWIKINIIREEVPQRGTECSVLSHHLKVGVSTRLLMKGVKKKCKMNFEANCKTSQKPAQQHHPETPAGQGSWPLPCLWACRSPGGIERGGYNCSASLLRALRQRMWSLL